jgi:hypothetical protein
MATVSLTSNDGTQPSASAVLEVSATNPEYNRPALRVKQAGTRGRAASIRIDPNPDIEFVETGLTNPTPGAGKFEIAVQADRLQINGRRDAVSPADIGFDTIVGDFGGFGEGQGAIVIANASVAPTVNFAGAGILYVQDGALIYRGANGTVTMIAPA